MKMIRGLLNVSVIFTCFFIVGFSLYKIIHKKSPPLLNQQILYTEPRMHWHKNILYLPINSISIQNERTATIGNNYSLVEEVISKNSDEKCLLGNYNLQKKSRDMLVFFSSNKVESSNMFLYSEISKEKTMVTWFTEKEMTQHTNMISCKNWVKISRHFAPNHAGLQENQKTLFLKVAKCLRFSGHKYLGVEIEDNPFFNISYNILKNKVEICAIKPGVAFAKLIVKSSPQPLEIQIRSTYKPFSSSTKRTRSTHAQRHFSATLAGWQ